MTEEKIDEKIEKNFVEQDMFVDDFITYKTITVKDRIDPAKTRTYKFGLKEISGFEEDRITKDSMKLNGRTGSVEIDRNLANIRYLQAVVVEAPFEKTEQNFKRLSKKIRDQLLEEARKINEVPDDLEKK